jgi:gamma-butyrobetaine dioxygenase
VTAIVDEIFDLFARFGSGRYGENLSLGEHMLQSAMLAQSLGASDALVVAALLHDIGYFLHRGEDADEEHDFEHEALGAAWLSRVFGEEVTRPIALHVQAKRYLCAVDRDYYAQLSDMSRRTLSLQGGVMREREACAFERDPAFESTLLLRRCDDRGKDTSARTPSLEEFRSLILASVRPSS